MSETKTTTSKIEDNGLVTYRTTIDEVMTLQEEYENINDSIKAYTIKISHYQTLLNSANNRLKELNDALKIK